MYLFQTLPTKCIKYSPHLIIKYISIPILVNKIEWPTSHNIYVGISLSEFCSKLPPPRIPIIIYLQEYLLILLCTKLPPLHFFFTFFLVNYLSSTLDLGKFGQFLQLCSFSILQLASQITFTTFCGNILKITEPLPPKRLKFLIN